MARQQYYLFVDEVKPSDIFNSYNFTGIAMKACEYQQFAGSLNQIKANALTRLGGKDINIHFTKLIRREKGSDFETLTFYEEQSLWIDLYSLYLNTEYHIISGIVQKDRYNACYPQFRVDLEILAFKTLLQNFVRYLLMNNGYGSIIVESSNDDEKIREEYYRTKFLGSKYITSEGYKAVLRGISFENKSKLNEGLQLVDCIANPISRRVSGITQFNLGKFGSMDYNNP